MWVQVDNIKCIFFTIKKKTNKFLIKFYQTNLSNSLPKNKIK